MNETQLSLWVGPAVARRTDPETSKIAAHQIEKGSALSHRVLCYESIKRNPGMTAGEIALDINLLAHEVGKRLPELSAAGYIKSGESRKCRVNKTMMRTWWLA